MNIQSTSTAIWDYNTGFVFDRHMEGVTWRAPCQPTGTPGALFVPKAPQAACQSRYRQASETTIKGVPAAHRRHGGGLKIQGTWLPYDLCKRCPKFYITIRHELVPHFFMSIFSCLASRRKTQVRKLRFWTKVLTCGSQGAARQSDPKRIANVANQTPAAQMSSHSHLQQARA